MSLPAWYNLSMSKEKKHESKRKTGDKHIEALKYIGKRFGRAITRLADK